MEARWGVKFKVRTHITKEVGIKQKLHCHVNCKKLSCCRETARRSMPTNINRNYYYVYTHTCIFIQFVLSICFSLLPVLYMTLDDIKQTFEVSRKWISVTRLHCVRIDPMKIITTLSKGATFCQNLTATTALNYTSKQCSLIDIYGLLTTGRPPIYHLLYKEQYLQRKLFQH